jgi:hypothetical protein
LKPAYVIQDQFLHDLDVAAPGPLPHHLSVQARSAADHYDPPHILYATNLSTYFSDATPSTTRCINLT